MSEPLTVRVVHEKPKPLCLKWLDNFALCSLPHGHASSCLPLPRIPKRCAA
jgi:hypothetical protein